MQSKLLVLSLFSMALTLNLSCAQEAGELEHSVSPFTESITSRIYCVARINKVVSFLYTLHSKGVLRNLEALLNEAFFEDWKNFHQFRLLNDTEFQIEFIKKVFEILYCILEEDKSWDSDRYIRKGNIRSAPENLDDLFSGINRMHLYVKKRMRPVIKRDISLEQESRDRALGVDGVTSHFYKIRRLQRAKKILKRTEGTKFYTTKHSVRVKDPLQELSDIVTHDSVKLMLKAMIESKNLLPLLGLWDELEQFRYADDSRFFQEMLMSIFATYKKILITHAIDSTQQSGIADELDNILLLYENISQLSGQELLANIDTATDHLSDILREIEANENEVSLSRVIAQWLLPAGALGGILMYLFMRG